METSSDRDDIAEASGKTPRFGSYIGLVYVAAIAGVLSFAVLHDFGNVFDRLQPGMTPTEATAVLGKAQSETESEGRIVRTWHIQDGTTIQVSFRDGKLENKQKVRTAEGSRR